MMIHTITPSVNNKGWDTQIIKLTNQNSIIGPKVVRPMNKKTFFLTLGTNITSSR